MHVGVADPVVVVDRVQNLDRLLGGGGGVGVDEGMLADSARQDGEVAADRRGVERHRGGGAGRLDGHRRSATRSTPSSTATSCTPTGSTAGRESGSPLARSKVEPCSGHSTVHSSTSSSPSLSEASAWVQVSSSA